MWSRMTRKMKSLAANTIVRWLHYFRFRNVKKLDNFYNFLQIFTNFLQKMFDNFYKKCYNKVYLDEVQERRGIVMTEENVVIRIKRELESLEIIYNCKFTNPNTINRIIDSCVAISNCMCSDDFNEGDYFICLGELKQIFDDNLYYHFILRCLFKGCNLEFSLLGVNNENISK